MIADQPYHCQLHYLWLVNNSSDESLILGLVWHASSIGVSSPWPLQKNHLAAAWRANLNRLRGPAAATPRLFLDSNVLLPADAIATFQFRLHLKPSISSVTPVIEIWNPAYIQAITTNTRPQLRRPSPRKRETTGIGTARTESLCIYYSITADWLLTLHSWRQTSMRKNLA